MKKPAILLLTFSIGGLVWIHQHLNRTEQALLSAQLHHALAEQTERARQSDSEVLHASLPNPPLSSQASATSLLPSDQPVSVREEGGWPEGKSYFYLPKVAIAHANYLLLTGDQLTEEAALLFGMSSVERATVNEALEALFADCHQAEADLMQQADTPTDWPGSDFDSALVYHVPSLAAQVAKSRAVFAQQIQTAIGPVRAPLFEEAADAHLKKHWDELGSEERTVGFAWKTESDGTQSIWYAFRDPRHAGSFQRVEARLDPNSKIAYYARLLGVDLKPGP